MNMSAELISGVVGAIVSVALETIPGLREKWSAWEWKQMTMFALSLGVPVGVVTLSCSFGVELPVVTGCEQGDFINALILGVTHFLSTQTTFLAVSHRLNNAKERRPNLWVRGVSNAGMVEPEDRMPLPHTKPVPEE